MVTDVRHLSREEEVEMFRRWRGGDREAGDILARSQWYWVRRSVLGWRKRLGASRPFDEEELMGVGLECLSVAMDAWDEGRGMRLSTLFGVIFNREVPKYADRMWYSVRLPCRAVMADEGGQLREKFSRDRWVGESSVEERAVGDGGGLVWRAMDYLSPRQRAVVEGKLAGRSINSMAREWGVERHALGQVYKAALHIMREALSRMGVSD